MDIDTIRREAEQALAAYRTHGPDARPDDEIDWVIIEMKDGHVSATGPVNGGIDGILTYLLEYEDGYTFALRPLYQAA